MSIVQDQFDIAWGLCQIKSGRNFTCKFIIPPTEQRYLISVLKKAGFHQSIIATDLNMHNLTIYREIKRNRGNRYGAPRSNNLNHQPHKIMGCKVSFEIFLFQFAFKPAPSSATLRGSSPYYPYCFVAARLPSRCQLECFLELAETMRLILHQHWELPSKLNLPLIY